MQCAWLSGNLPEKKVNCLDLEDCVNLIFLEANFYEKQLSSSKLILVKFPDLMPTICRHIQFTVSGPECDIRMDFDTSEYPNIFVSRK